MVSPTPDLDDLFRRYASRLYRYVRLRLPPADAEEVVSETFVTAWRRQADLPAEPEPWLLAVARRLTANRVRAVNRRTAAWRRLPRREQVVPDHAEAVGEAELALRALDRLSKRDREIIALLMTSDLTPDQLGTILGCSANAAAVRSHRARKRLSEAYAIEDRAVDTATRAPSSATARLAPPRGEQP